MHAIMYIQIEICKQTRARYNVHVRVQPMRAIIYIYRPVHAIMYICVFKKPMHAIMYMYKPVYAIMYMCMFNLCML